MKALRASILILSGASALSLSACGEGYEMVPFHGSVPYTEERTAGSGVAYVRKMMLPEKGPVLVPQETVPVTQTDTVIEDAAPLFGGNQLKK